MDKAGLVISVAEAAAFIDIGRKGFATKGNEREGRISYEKGIAEALAAFQKAQASADPQAIYLAEYTFLSQELEFCHATDKASHTSLVKAIQSFDDAFLVLKIVEEKTYYHITDKSFPHDKKYRISGFPKDSFHIAGASHQTRINNILRAPGIDPIEKELLKQRLSNLLTAQNSYIEKQKKAMAN